MSVHDVIKKAFLLIFALALLAAPNIVSARTETVLSQKQFEKKLDSYIEEAKQLLRDMPKIKKGQYETKKEYRKRKEKALKKSWYALLNCGLKRISRR